MALLSILMAFIGYSVLNIAQAGQKIGLETMSRRRVMGAVVWLISLIGTSVSVFIVLYAVSLGSVALAGAMAGSGLASLALFSALVMKEKIAPREILGIGILFGAAILIGVFLRETDTGAPDLQALYFFLAIAAGLYLLLLLAARKRREIIGLIISGFSGALGGFVPLFQKVSLSAMGLSRSFLAAAPSSARGQAALFRRAAEILANPYAVIWVLLSIASMIIIQFAYRRDRAVRLVPAFTASYILVPLVGGVLCFAERLHPVQWLGVAMILVGLLMLTVKAPRSTPSP